MPPRNRRDPGEPLAVRAAHAVEEHRTQVTSYGFVSPRRPKRSVTVTPRPLRYWQYDPVGPVVLALVVVGVAIWLGVLASRGGAARVADEVPLAVGLALVVLLGSTGRTTVSDAALSLDVAGLRQVSSFQLVPLVLVREVVAGRPPADWPESRRRARWWPGRKRVSVRHLATDGEGDRAFTAWVRDPAAFADALGHPLREL
jgi:hypothetical protein